MKLENVLISSPKRHRDGLMKLKSVIPSPRSVCVRVRPSLCARVVRVHVLYCQCERCGGVDGP